MKIEFEFQDVGHSWEGIAWVLSSNGPKKILQRSTFAKPEDLKSHAKCKPRTFDTDEYYHGGTGSIEMAHGLKKPKDSKTKPNKPINQTSSLRDPYGINKAAISFLMLKLKHQWSNLKEGYSPQTESEAILCFIDEMQRRALDFAASSEQIIAPINFTEEYWTPAFVKQLARILSSPKKRRDILDVKGYLVYYWRSEKLFQLDRDELAAWVNRELSVNIKPNTVWQTAYRLGLFSDRIPGPKPRS